ncbi:phosphoethanolamine--lipid A transferase [Psychrobacter sp.]|uniref:phosphoethanolamine transferase n=1 Tax=Psychrobacter sp. TaxID=56811 RepID=UPI0025DDD2FA|nr:phosphoethanolamine--lipid A transferase [Psychrobacter sp.]
MSKLLTPNTPLSNDTNDLNDNCNLPFFKRLSHYHINLNVLILLVALFLTLTANLSFFSKVLAIYPIANNLGFVISTGVLLFGVIWFLLQLVTYRPVHKFILGLLIIVAAICAYFTDSYGTIFDTNMLVNGLETDHAEAMDLFAPSFLIRVLLLGVLPVILLSLMKIKPSTFKHAVLQRVISILACLGLIALCLLPFGDQYASFFRQHKPVRYYANPVMPIYSLVKMGTDKIDDMRRPKHLIPHAEDAKLIAPAVINSQSGSAQPIKPKLMVMVVGETARADHVSLNGYARNTMPLLAKTKDIYSFKDVSSCGTSTAYSVPCMFSYAGRKDYKMDQASYNENVIDTLHKLGVNVIWRDNNSSSKGVADRVTFEDYKSNKLNPECDSECRDIGMLKDFDKIVAKPQNTLLVLHQMGNHGPAYYKRYPKEFEVFKPVCESNELSKCDNQSVINAYDNAIVYTDYFLHNIIETLKPYEQQYDVVMIYVSDHGESLGENNIYLHGLPYSIAPKAQKQVPLIVWSPASNHIDTNSIVNQLDKPVSHDYLTPTLLSYFGITTQEVENKPTLFKTLN